MCLNTELTASRSGLHHYLHRAECWGSMSRSLESQQPGHRQSHGRAAEDRGRPGIYHLRYSDNSKL